MSQSPISKKSENRNNHLEIKHKDGPSIFESSRETSISEFKAMMMKKAENKKTTTTMKFEMCEETKIIESEKKNSTRITFKSIGFSDTG